MLRDINRLRRHIADDRGRLWPIPAGAAGDPPPAEDPSGGGDPPAGDPPSDGDDGEPLGDAGKKALEQERAARREAEKARRKVEAELEELRKQSMTGQERAIAEAKAQARKEALTEANRRVVTAEVKAIAAGKLANPTLAVRLLDLSQFEVDDDGNTDAAAITAAVDRLLLEEPYLAKDATSRANGTADGGARGGSAAKTPDMNALLRAAVTGRK